MKEFTTITLSEGAGLNRVNEPLTFGVPLPEGFSRSCDCLTLTSKSGERLAADITPALTWPDQSLRWVHIQTIINQQADEVQQLSLRRTDNTTLSEPDPAPRSSVAFTDGALEWKTEGPDALHYSVSLTDNEGHSCQAKCDGNWARVHEGSIAQTCQITGDWLRSDGTRLARFTCNVTTYTGTQLQKVEVCIHNPQRARHPGGLWDLGDPGSVHFSSLSVQASQYDSHEATLYPASDTPDIKCELDGTTRLHQESSGGEHWNSRNHINAKGTVLPRYRGFLLSKGYTEVSSGLRASPLIALTNKNGQTLRASYPKFWQNFPSAIEASADTLSLELFPKNTAEPHELQGGERKTQTLWFDISDNPDSLHWTHSPLIPQIAAKDYEHAHAFPWFAADTPKTTLDTLIQQGVEGEQNFFAKREIIDEYGWRNFGDIFADHETLYQEKGERPHVSHYNNQYDGIYGFARQFALTGNPRWFELMDDLARHVADIDIYHTDDDRAEYNHGLFWHTDHYLDAHTCTHRTFTRHNNSSSTPGQLGGGPAAEHCYTTGHLYHYWLTGNPSSREAVLKLTNWMQTLHQGQRGLLAEALALKKQELPKLKAMLRGDQVSPHRYPFTRGTGNYITALLDAHLLEPANGWLAQAEIVIQQTIHPADDIETRDLLDTEIGWSYLILLASIARYLQIKKEAGERDGQWRYARDSFLHYTEWMLKHERPFLSDTTGLEFANDTWTAQDVRKAMLMFQAAQEDPQKAQDYQVKGREWLDYVTTALQTSPEYGLTRLQIILLQNYGPQHLDVPDGAQSPAKHNDSSITYQAPLLGWGSLVGQIVARLMKGLLHFRPRREKAWLEARLDR